MELVKDELKIKIFDTRERMGRAAAKIILIHSF